MGMKGAAAALIAVFILSACMTVAGDDVLAEVNSRKITKKNVMTKSALYGLEVSDEGAVRDFLNLLINDYLILEAAKEDMDKLSLIHISEPTRPY